MTERLLFQDFDAATESEARATVARIFGAAKAAAARFECVEWVPNDKDTRTVGMCWRSWVPVGLFPR